jgi:hypothetical protein
MVVLSLAVDEELHEQIEKRKFTHVRGPDDIHIAALAVLFHVLDNRFYAHALHSAHEVHGLDGFDPDSPIASYTQS